MELERNMVVIYFNNFILKFGNYGLDKLCDLFKDL